MIVKPEINDVTDTALWVAAYRAEETERKDALFRDPLARVLVGDKGALMAMRTQGSRFTAWSVVIRTTIIDQFIQELIEKKKIDTVLNLGAGLDTRPYRLAIPKDIRWIEVDFPKIIAHKNNLLKDEMPKCRLERRELDLSIDEERRSFFSSVSASSKKVLILTEGVVPYLSNNDVKTLAQDLLDQKKFEYWITEYYSPEILQFLRTPKRLNQMKNAPFLFYPDDWFGFYKAAGWIQLETKYFGIESEKLGRTPPTPAWIDDPAKKEAAKSFLGYSILERTATA
jgi:methyltransferase (TIGR00027 family)